MQEVTTGNQEIVMTPYEFKKVRLLGPGYIGSLYFLTYISSIGSFYFLTYISSNVFLKGNQKQRAVR